MYAVVKTGGKQYRVAEGDRLEVERVEGESIELAPIIVVDGDKVLTAAADLASLSVRADVVGESAGKKINAFTYKNKSNQRKRYGHRQHYSVIEIKSIGAGSAPKKKAT